VQLTVADASRDIIADTMKKLVAGLTALVVLIVLQTASVGQSKPRGFIDTISLPIKNTTLRMVNVSRYETEGDSKITFKELIERIELDIAEIEKRILDVQTLAAPNQKRLADPAVNYMRATQDLLRASLAKYRKALDFGSASEEVKRALHEAASDRALFEYKMDVAMNADRRQKEAAVELSRLVSEVASSVKVLKGALSRVVAVARFPSGVLIDPAILESISKKNESKIEDAPQSSSLVGGLLAPSTQPDAAVVPPVSAPAPRRPAKQLKAGKKPEGEREDPFQ
jgi:hypothetical protein